jgi:mRNA interferase MazF
VQRGEIWTVAGGPDYAGKPRPAVIVQDDAFAATGSVTICLLTSDPTDAPLLRLPLPANADTGLALPSRIMIDKLTTVARTRLGARIGRLASDDMVRLNQALMVFLGLAGGVRR